MLVQVTAKNGLSRFHQISAFWPVCVFVCVLGNLHPSFLILLLHPPGFDYTFVSLGPASFEDVSPSSRTFVLSVLVRLAHNATFVLQGLGQGEQSATRRGSLTSESCFCYFGFLFCHLFREFLELHPLGGGLYNRDGV